MTVTIIGCDSNTDIRKVESLYTETFMSKYGKVNDDSIIDMLESDLNKVFNLRKLNTTSDQGEIRIYYIGVSCERFFRQSFDSGRTITELYDCRTDRKGDSLFMKIGKHIISNKNYDRDKLPDLVSIPAFKINCQSDLNNSDVVDGLDFYFIQAVDYSSKIKSIVINDPFGLEIRDIEAKAICEFLRTITEKYNFKFCESSKEILKKAFTVNLKPVGTNKLRLSDIPYNPIPSFLYTKLINHAGPIIRN